MHYSLPFWGLDLPVPTENGILTHRLYYGSFDLLAAAQGGLCIYLDSYFNLSPFGTIPEIDYLPVCYATLNIFISEVNRTAYIEILPRGISAPDQYPRIGESR